MATPTETNTPLHIKQRDWLKKMGKVLETKVDDAAKQASSTAGGNSAAAPNPTQPGQNAPANTSAGQENIGNQAKDIAARIIDLLTAERDLSGDLKLLAQMDMQQLLDVMIELKKAGKLTDFANRFDARKLKQTAADRIHVAVFTVQPVFGAAWRELVDNLNDADRKAVLARTPQDVLKGSGISTKAPGGKKDDGGPEGTVSIDSAGVTVSASLTFTSKFGDLGTTNFSVNLNKDGKLSEVEVDVTMIKSKLEQMQALVPMLELKGSLSLTSKAKLDQKDTQVIFKGVQSAVKAKIEVGFKTIKALKSVKFYLAAKQGREGREYSAWIEIPIPGT